MNISAQIVTEILAQYDMDISDRYANQDLFHLRPVDDGISFIIAQVGLTHVSARGCSMLAGRFE
jgi:hypothetical protein